MADDAEKEMAEKRAAARKRFEQLRKQKGKGQNVSEKKKVEDQSTAIPSESTTAVDNVETAVDGDAAQGALPEASEESDQVPADPQTSTEDQDGSGRSPHNRQASISLQSRMRSSSFRRTSISQNTPLATSPNGTKSANLPPLSPGADSVSEIYRKQASRLDELEKENKRLAKELENSEIRWRRSEDELEDLRESSGQLVELQARAATADAQSEELNRIRSDNAALNRQISTLQSQPRATRQPSVSQYPPSSSSPDSLSAQLASKSATIESMELEISNLRAQLSQNGTSSSSQSEQVAALEAKLDKAERAAGAAQRQLTDAKKNLDRLTEKAVKEGGERTSVETKLKTLTREAEDSRKQADEAVKRVETLEKKLSALTTLHKDADGRRQTGERERERAEKEVADLRRKMAGMENENLRLREESERLRMRGADGAGTGDDGLDEIEEEERRKLEAKIRELEGEVFDLRRGAWKERKRELQSVSTGGGAEGDEVLGSPSGGFDDVDLSAPASYVRRQSVKTGSRSGGFAGVLSAFTRGGAGGGGDRKSLDLMDDFDDAGFDEEAFRKAHEDEEKRRLERVREIKRGLKDWEGWRMDVVDSRMGGVGGTGDIFDI
ncbi:hypothetical protein MMC25_002473 [Agyrium rufum]|nr:hypothetical protein [Agyrium rufum]